MTVIKEVAPYAKATHIKDMAVMSCQSGLLMSVVPLGAGTLDLPRMVSVLQKANPAIRFALETITRDPLEVPGLTDYYWTTFPDRNDIYLARTLRYVSEHQSSLPKSDHLPPEERQHVEEENIRSCFRHTGRAA